MKYILLALFIQALHYWTIVALVAGTLCFITFVSRNLYVILHVEAFLKFYMTYLLQFRHQLDCLQLFQCT